MNEDENTENHDSADSNGVIALFQEIETYIAEADAKLQEGLYLELSDLNGRVDELCQRILKQPKEIGQAHADALERLSVSLTALKANMEKAKAHLVEETNSLEKRKKAAKSYRTSPTPKPN